MLVGVATMPDAHQRAPGGLDLLRDGHEVAVAADDHHRADVREAADVLRRVEAELDVGAVLGRRAGREQLDQLDRVLQQCIAVAPVTRQFS